MKLITAPSAGYLLLAHASDCGQRMHAQMHASARDACITNTGNLLQYAKNVTHVL